MMKQKVTQILVLRLVLAGKTFQRIGLAPFVAHQKVFSSCWCSFLYSSKMDGYIQERRLLEKLLTKGGSSISVLSKVGQVGDSVTHRHFEDTIQPNFALHR